MRTAINPMGNIDMAKDYIIDYGNNGLSGNDYQWYRIWKSGWIEQGGNATSNIEFNFIKPFLNIPTITGLMINTDSQYTHTWRCFSVNNKSAKFIGAYSGTIYAYSFNCYACGY